MREAKGAMQSKTEPDRSSRTLPIGEEPQERVLNVDCLFDAFIETDQNGLITGWNLLAKHTFGWSCQEVWGLPASQLIIPVRNRHLFQEMVARVIHGGRNSDGQSRQSRIRMTVLHRDGQEFEIEAVFFGVGSGEKAGCGILARQPDGLAFTEIEGDQRHHQLMDQLSDCYNEVDLRGKTTFVNKAFCETYGVLPGDRVGTHYRASYSAELVNLFHEVYTKVYSTGKPAKIDYEYTLRNGRKVFNEQRVSLRRDAQGNIIGFMVIVRDSFERRQHELELEKAKHAAEAASKLKSEFLANMSHEIRTPLNGVIGMLELMGYAHPTPEQQELLATAQDAAHNLLSLINDTLDFSKIEAGKLELDHTEFDLREMLAKAIGVMTITARRKGLALSCEVAPDVPAQVLGDPNRLKQVLLNLIGNALKFTPRGQVKVLVQAKPQGERQAELKFSVVDTGIGIPAEKQTSIFEAFRQADASTTRKFGGTGLGLAICSRIVQLMQGSISVESQVGQGSTFNFTAVFEVADHGASRHSPHVAADKLIGSKELRILLAEDNPVNQRLAVRLLEKLGHKVAVVTSGVAVVSQVAEQQFDLILMDIQMPEMDGFAATAAIRSLAPNPMANVPIVAMTAHATNGARERCLEAGMDDYIAKPISMAVIQDTIAGILESRSTAAEDTTLADLSPDAGTAGERSGKSLMKQGSGSHD